MKSKYFQYMEDLIKYFDLNIKDTLIAVTNVDRFTHNGEGYIAIYKTS